VPLCPHRAHVWAHKFASFDGVIHSPLDALLFSPRFLVSEILCFHLVRIFSSPLSSVCVEPVSIGDQVGSVVRGFHALTNGIISPQ
jgi:hypothetical protein